jgi:hypothetical protein
MPETGKKDKIVYEWKMIFIIWGLQLYVPSAVTSNPILVTPKYSQKLLYTGSALCIIDIVLQIYTE